MTHATALFDNKKIGSQVKLSLRADQSREHEPFYWQGDDTAALLIHGFPGTAAEMRPVARVLHEQGWTVQGLLLSGFGKDIASIGDYCWTEWAAQVKNALHALRQTHERVVLVGNSMGGALCIDVAARGYGDALLLFAPFWRVANRWLDALYPIGRMLFPSIKPFIRADFTNKDFRATVQRMMPDADLDDNTVRAAIRDIKMPTSVLGQIRNGGRAAFAGASRVQQPITIVQGAEDEVVATELTQQMAQRLPNLVAFWQVRGGHDIALLNGANGKTMTTIVNQFVRSYANSRPPVRLYA